MPAESDSAPDFAGEDYLAVLDRFHRELRPKTYLEIGAHAGNSLAVARCASLAVDPEFVLSSAAPLLNKPFCALYQMTSDAFFATVDPTVVLGRTIDFAFLDGMHLCEFLLRDFLNTERFCAANSVIALHDCLPLDLTMAKREYPDPAEQTPSREGWWTGDVWRCALSLKRRRPELRMTALDAPPTGLVLITNLTPGAPFSHQTYFSMVEEMQAMSLSELTIEGLRAELNLEATSSYRRFEEIARRFWL